MRIEQHLRTWMLNQSLNHQKRKVYVSWTHFLRWNKFELTMQCNQYIETFRFNEDMFCSSTEKKPTAPNAQQSISFLRLLALRDLIVI